VCNLHKNIKKKCINIINTDKSKCIILFEEKKEMNYMTIEDWLSPSPSVADGKN